MEMTEFDYVIVGGGTAGCVIATRLVEDASVSVCLIEGGEAYEHDPLVLGYHGSVPLLGDPRYDYDYGIVQQEVGNSSIRHSRAKMLGGCSSHNDTVAFRPPDRDFTQWESEGAAGWGPAAVRPYFDAAARQLNVHQAPANSVLARAVHEAALSIGLPEVMIHGDRDLVEGAGWLHLNELDGVRRSTAVAYLYPLDELPANLVLMLNTWTTGILIEGDRAVGVTTDRGEIRARGEVILCAGAIDTPKLLLLSGIGANDQLSAHGIPTKLELPGVGERLRDHAESVVMWETDRETGPSLQNAESAIFTRTRPELEGFDLFSHIITQPYYVNIPSYGYATGDIKYGFCLAGNNAKPHSSGHIRLASADPLAPPVIDPQYLSDPGGEDERILLEGIWLGRHLAEQPALRDWIVREVLPGPSVQTDEQLRAYVRSAHGTVYHPAGTCAMGAISDRDAVVGPDLCVRGLRGLRVADASVFPSMISVNLCLTVAMIAERCAALIRGVSTAG